MIDYSNKPLKVYLKQSYHLYFYSHEIGERINFQIGSLGSVRISSSSSTSKEYRTKSKDISETFFGTFRTSISSF